MRACVHRFPLHAPRRDAAEHGLAILEQVDRGERIARIERIEWIGAVRLLPIIEEARQLRNRVIDRAAVVVVAEQPAIGITPKILGAQLQRHIRS